MLPQGPFALTGSVQTINITNPPPGGAQIRLANESPYALKVSVGGTQDWLDPWTVDVWPLNNLVTSIQVTPTVLIPVTPTPPAASLLITVSEGSETFPGVYPMPLDRQAQIQLATLQLLGLEDPAGNEISGTGAASSNVNPSGWPFGLDTYSSGLIVSRRTSAPADWEVATAGAVINAAPGNGSFSQIITAPGVNHRLIVLWAAYQTSTSGVATNAFGNLADDSGAVILSRYSQNFSGVIEKLVRGPVKLPANQGLRLTNEGAVGALFLQGAVLYTISNAG